MRTGNPALTSTTFGQLRSYSDQAMTINGTVNKTGIMMLLLLMGAAYTWDLYSQSPALVRPWMLGSALAGLVLALVTIFKKTWAPITAPLYALVEGLLLGAISAFYNARYEGIVFQAVGLTVGVLASLLLAYRTGFIRATENFKLGVFAATMGIGLIYLLTFILGFFGTQIPYIHGNGIMGICFSLFVVVIAAFNLVLDFDFIEQGAANGAPRYMEWYAAFGLMVTLIWLYVEILRLLAKLRSRN